MSRTGPVPDSEEPRDLDGPRGSFPREFRCGYGPRLWAAAMGPRLWGRDYGAATNHFALRPWPLVSPAFWSPAK
jgi:hypothetical protein